jgi:BirA family biotin operon repressor/biotin-[acetyl-CoA-carboxylase] ligase
MRRAFDLLNSLADGAERSGEDLAKSLGVTRAAVWNQIRKLRRQGLSIVIGPNGGYLLQMSYSALNAKAITASLRKKGVDHINCSVEFVVDSTNERLLQGLTGRSLHGDALCAEYQTLGRGRRGDKWISPPGSGICLSLCWFFGTPPSTFSALSLAVGISIIKRLEDLGAKGLQLKWPNDIMRDEKKIAGILIEMRAESAGMCKTVIGVGINFDLPKQAKDHIDRPAGDLGGEVTHHYTRNEVIGEILAGLSIDLERFGRLGFEIFTDDWRRLDLLHGQKVRLELGERDITGIAAGVDSNGALIIENSSGVERFLSGHLVLL